MSESKKGELIRTGTSSSTAPRPTGKSRTVGRLLSMLSIWPFRNRSFIKSLETATEVIKKQNELEETVIKHAHTRGRLNDLGITLAREEYERRRMLLEEQQRYSEASNTSKRQHKLMDQKNKLEEQQLRIQQMEQDKRELQLNKELEELRKPAPASTPPPKTTRGRSEKQKRIDQAYKRYEKELERINKMNATPARKEALRKAAREEYEQEAEKIQGTF